MTDTEHDTEPPAPLPFVWSPDPKESRPFNTLRTDDNQFMCPYPGCGHKSPAAQGLSRHMTYQHGWQSSKPRLKPPKSRLKPPSKRMYPSDVAKTRKVVCTLSRNGHQCGRTVRYDYLKGHLREYHHLDGEQAQTTMQAILNGQGPKPRRSPTPRQPRPEPETLTAADICQTVLGTVLPNGSIPVWAIPAYNEWVAATATFLETVSQ